MKNTPKNIAIEKLFPFEGHPFKVQDNEEMNALIESIQEQGILSPLIVRPKENTEDEYEIVSGHRRFRAAVKAGIKEVPALIVPLDRDAAAIAVVDSNLHREHILPSEKAFAYKLKAEALRHQGKRSDLTSEQVAPKLATEIIAESDNTSKDTVKRYIRLTNLIPPILDMVDEKRIAFTPAVELSYLLPEEHSFDSVNRDAQIRRILGVGVDFEYEMIAREDWIGRRLVADKFRDHRIFLAGDAAHQGAAA